MTTLQITLSDAERAVLRTMAERTGKAEEELLRDGLTLLLEQSGAKDWKSALKKGRGLWKDRTDLPDLRELREGGTRYPDEE
jgi:hypothetical protein